MIDSELTAEPQEITVAPEAGGQRLDAFLAEQFPRYSRVLLRKLIAAGGVQVDGRPPKVAYRLKPGQVLTVRLPPLPRESPLPEPIPLEILYEDEFLVALSKPADMVVHPARGHWSGTLSSALAYHFEQLSAAGGPTRPGIVHRLDRETSGVMVIAKTDAIHLALAAQFEQRTVEKEYVAIACGALDRDRDWINQPIGIHPYQREKMAIRSGHPTSREAQTYFEVLERYRGFLLVRLLPKTGRTHQIRIHLAHVGAPVLCDKLYGGRSRISVGELRGVPGLEEFILERHALHAQRLSITHPVTEARLTFEAPMPADMQRVLDALRNSTRQ